MRNLAIRLGLLGAIGVGGVVLSPYLMGAAGDLKVGECFDLPDAAVQEVEEVQHHPCTETHTAEVIYVGTLSGDDDAVYPSDAAMETEVFAACDAAFTAYTGLDPYTDATWTYGWFAPTPDGWSGGDRGYTCHAVRLDEAPTTTSVRVGSAAS